MRAEDTIQFMMNTYPQLYNTRLKCLNTLFCKYGHDYVWRNGEICLEDWDGTLEPKKHVAKAKPTKRCKEEEQEDLRMIEILKSRGLLDMIPSKWTTISQYSLINLVPVDIKPDWLELLNECKALLKEDGVLF